MIFDEAFLNKFYSNIGKPNKNDCTEWLRKTKHHRYGNIKLKGKDYKVHRISYQINFGEIPKNMYVCHSCDNTWCVNPEHLFLGSQLDNVRDMIKKGRKTVLKGTQLYEAKLNEKKIIAIKTKLEKGIPVKEVALQYKVSTTIIRGIAAGKGWKHLKISINVPRHKRFKLRENDVIEILNLYKQGYSCVEIAKKYKVRHFTIKRILIGDGWKHVKRE